MQNSTKKVFHFVWEILRLFPMAIVAEVMTILAIPVASFLNPRTIKNISDQLILGSFEGFFFYAKIFVATEIFVGLAYRCSFFFKYIGLYPNAFVIIGSKLVASLSNKKSLFYLKNTSGQIGNTINLLNNGFKDIMQSFNFLMPLFLALFSCISLYLVSAKFAVINQIWFLGWVFLIWLLYDETNQKASRYYSGMSIVFGQMIDFLNNVFFVKISYSEAQEKQFFAEKLEKNAQENRNFHFMLFLPQLWYGFGAVLVQIINLYLIYIGIKSGSVKPTDSIIILTTNQAVFAWSWLLAESIGKMTGAISQISEGLRVLEEDDEEHELQQIENNNTQEYSLVQKQDLVLIKGDIKFNSVTFGYNKNLLFKEQSILIQGGSKVAIVGSSGAGKSTFASLLLRTNEPNMGSIEIDDQDLGNVTRKSLYDNIAVIAQNLTLFNRTILENIAYPKFQGIGFEVLKDEDKAAVIKAAKLAMIDDFIEELPEKYDTIISEGGASLSGGQKQRILIARAFFKDAPILIMDEFSSALDSFTEEQICSNIVSNIVNKTCIIITHRMRILNFVDRILLLENGKIVEDGSLEELIALNGKFSKLFKN